MFKAKIVKTDTEFNKPFYEGRSKSFVFDFWIHEKLNKCIIYKFITK